MQDNKYISKQYLQTYFTEKNFDATRAEKLINDLANKGYTIEGFNEPTKEQRAAKLDAEIKKQTGTGLMQAISDVGTGMSEAKTLSDVGTTLSRGVLRGVGAGAGAVNETLGTAITSAAKGADTLLGNIPSTAIKAGGEAFLATETGKKALSAIQKGVQDWEAYKLANPEGAKDLEAAVNIATVFPMVKGFAKGVDATIDTAKLVSNLGAKAVKPVANVIKNTGEKLYSSAFSPNVKEAEQMLAYEASRPASFAEKIYGSNALQGNAAFKPITQADSSLRAGIAGTEKQVGVQAKRAADTLYNKEIAPAVKSIEGVITKDELFNPLQETINGITDPSKKKAYQNALEALKEDYINIDKFTYQEAQKLKSELAEFTPAKVFRGQDVANETRMLQADIAGIIRSKTYEALKDVNIRQKYLDYGNLKELEKVGVKAISEQKLKGGFGGFWTQVYDTAMTPIKTIGGKTVYKIGDKLQVSAPEGYDGQPLRKYLESIGYLAPAITQNQND